MAAASTTVTATGTISPKVFWPLLVGVGLTFVSSFLAGLTPEMLTALGPMAVPMAFALGSVSQTITAYLKGDELRDLGVQATAAILPAAPTSHVVPDSAPEPEQMLSFSDPVVEDEPTAIDDTVAEVDPADQLVAKAKAARATGSTAV